LRWNSILAAFFLVVWIAAIPCILFSDDEPIIQVNAFIVSLASFPLFVFYVARYDEETVIPLNYAKHYVELDGIVLFIGRLLVLGFIVLLMWGAILLGLINAGDAANDIAIYAYCSLVLGVALIALSSWGRREMILNGMKIERGSLDIYLSSSYRFLRTRLREAWPSD